ncbi:hypothetical protein N657DRAFT_313002 [Parathielavia appendiculata]|uniref:Uncharacterized protein n=1 Tax=Parathielavia appendiculata TaxID=2587402 RepID=A0AAN6U7Q8_9PEZI|nr:hypothetical protein N657DRAFT_313002 [Parathielavia appendiculata]
MDPLSFTVSFPDSVSHLYWGMILTLLCVITSSTNALQILFLANQTCLRATKPSGRDPGRAECRLLRNRTRDQAVSGSIAHDQAMSLQGHVCLRARHIT